MLTEHELVFKQCITIFCFKSELALPTSQYKSRTCISNRYFQNTSSFSLPLLLLFVGVFHVLKINTPWLCYKQVLIGTPVVVVGRGGMAFKRSSRQGPPRLRAPTPIFQYGVDRHKLSTRSLFTYITKTLSLN